MTKNHVITGDECWIYWDNYLPGQWTADRAAVSPQIHNTISSNTIMISAYFTRQRFVSIQALPETEQFNSTFSIITILPNILQFVSVFHSKIQAQGH
jgi:hypothetical protein